jgi:hypothetical protein
MTFKFNAVVAAAITLAGATSAHANFNLANGTTFGNSSVTFVAMDTGANISLVVDLGAVMTNFLPNVPGQTSGAGVLSAAGTTAVWNFASNTYTINGVAQSGATYSWASQVSGFLSNTNVTTNGYQWGVIAGDNANGAVSGTNLVRGQNILFTGATPDFDNTVATGTTGAQLNNATGNITDFYANNNNTGTHSSTVKGASTATSGPAFLGTTMAANGVADFGGGAFGQNSFLVDTGTVSYFTWATNTNPVSIYSLGAGVTTGSLSPTAATFTWNAANSTLTYAVPVPEPETYALMLAGLGLVGAAARRRAAR